MSENIRVHKTAKEILAESLEKFKLPTAMTMFKDDSLRQLARLVWALQILLKDVFSYIDVLGNAHELMKRIERLENTVLHSQGVLTDSNVCELLGISKKHLNRLIAEQDLPCHKPTRKMRLFHVAELVEWVQKHPIHRFERPIEKTGLLKTTNHEQPTATTADSAGLSPAE